MAGEIAPGLDLAGKDSQDYKMLVVNDVELASEVLEYKKQIRQGLLDKVGKGAVRASGE